MKHLNLLSVLTFIFLALMCLQCGHSDNLYNEPSAAISMHSKGQISRSDKIYIEFYEPLTIRPDEIAEKAAKAIQIKPRIEGEWRLVGNRRLVFFSSKLLPSGSDFKIRADIGKLIETTESSFDFQVSTIAQAISIEENHISMAASGKADHLDISLKILSRDVVSFEELNESLQIIYKGEKTSFEWLNTGQNTAFDVVISDLERSERSTPLQISWSGQLLGMKESGKVELPIPVKGIFEFWTATMVMENPRHVLITFTDVLDPAQELDGLITLQDYNGAYNFLRDKNKVRFYFDENLSGDYRINISEKLRSDKGKALSKFISHTMSFYPPEPALRFSSSGNVMSGKDNKFILPIEVINLHSVDVEVFKIFKNNVHQFLQMQSEDYYRYNWNRVGRLIKQETIELERTGPQRAGQWQRYGLDLGHLIDGDPEAMYEIRIGFRPEHATLTCAGALKTDTPTNLKDLPVMESFFDSYSGWCPDDENCWRDRNNPCTWGFYTSSRFVAKTVFSSDLGLVIKQGENKSWVAFTTHLDAAKAASNVNVTFYDFQQQVIFSGNTNQDGFLEVFMEKKPFIATAEKGKHKSYLILTEGQSLSLSSFDIDGVKPQEGLKGFIFGEREVWRPGDSIYLQLILESNLPSESNLPVMCELQDPRGIVVQRYMANRGKNVLYDLRTATSPDAITGDYRLNVRAGGAVFMKAIKIESIKPNRLKVDYKNHTSSISSAQKKIEGTLHAEWLHGAIAAGLKADIVMEQYDIKQGSFPGFTDYTFHDLTKVSEREPQKIFQGTLDNTGSAKIEHELPSALFLSGKQNIRLRTTVYEKGGDFSVAYQSLDYSPFKAYVGVKLPKGFDARNRLDIDKSQSVAFLVLSETGTPLANVDVDVFIYELDWSYWWDSYDSYLQSYNNNQHRSIIQKIRLKTNKEGKTSFDPRINNWGSYLIRACLPSGHCTGEKFFVGYPYRDDDDSFLKPVFSESNLLKVRSDKDVYNTGQNVHISVPSSAEGRLLLSLENGHGVVQTQWFNISKGENKISFKTSAEMSPNVYAHLTLIQGVDGMSTDQPLRQYGVIPIKVEDPDSRLKPQLKLPKELEGDKTFVVEVSEKNGQPMEYSIAVVDEGLLNLTRFATPDPHAYFFAKEALGVRTWDFYDNILSAYQGTAGRVMSLGGDAAVRVEGTPTPNRFPPVVMFSGPYYLEKGKKASHSFHMPNYAGSVRVMLVAAGPKKYGTAEQSVKVKKPLMVFATLPRVLGPGEEVDIPVTVFSLEQKIKQATIQIEESNGFFEFPDGKSKRVNFGSKGEETIFIKAKIKDKTGVAKISVLANGEGSNASQEIELLVRNPNPPQLSVFDASINAGQSQNIRFSYQSNDAQSSAILELSTIPLLELNKKIDYLLHYPHGCLEQTISTAFPQLWLADIVQLSSLQKNRASNNTIRAIEKVNTLLQPNGTLVNWPGAQYDAWITTYAHHFLLEALDKGFAVNQSILRKLQQSEAQHAKSWRLQSANSPQRMYEQMLSQAYRLFVLARAGKAEMGAMNLLREEKELKSTAAILLSGAYALTGRRDVARQLVNAGNLSIPVFEGPGLYYGSTIRDRSLALMALLQHHDLNEAKKIAPDLIKELNSIKYPNTQTLSFGLSAIATFYNKFPPGQGIQASYSMNKGKKNVLNTQMNSLFVDLDANQSQMELNVENSGKSLMYARAWVRQSPRPGNEQPKSNGIDINVSYINEKNMPVDPNQLAQGEDFQAIVKVTRPGNHFDQTFKDIAVTQVFPSGWEIHNPRIADGQRALNDNKIVYQDFRDDRVLTYLNLERNNQITFTIHLKAAYKGYFYLPAHKVEAMYKEEIQANTKGQWISIKERKEDPMSL